MATIAKQLAENVTGAHALAPKSGQFSLNDVPDLSGKVAVVTGGSEGVGFATASILLQRNIARLFIVSARIDKQDEAKSQLEIDVDLTAAARITFKQVDLADWKSVVKVAEEIRSEADRLDILINDAGRGVMQVKQNEFGVDLHMSINHFGHVILTDRLLPLLKSTAEKHNTTVRIVNLSSSSHADAPKDSKFDSLDDINRDLGPNKAYGRSKLAVLLYARWLAGKLSDAPNVLVNATHPGVVTTAQSQEHIHDAYPLLGYGVSVLLRPFKKTALEGCVSTLFAATETTESGKYICPPAIIEDGTPLSQDKELGERLMNLTKEVLKEKAGIELENA